MRPVSLILRKKLTIKSIVVMSAAERQQMNELCEDTMRSGTVGRARLPESAGGQNAVLPSADTMKLNTVELALSLENPAGKSFLRLSTKNE